MNLGDRIKTVRKAQGLTQADFGKKIGISLSGVSMLEKGTNNPSEQTIRAICSEFSINRDWLVDGVGEMQATRPFVPELVRVLRNHPALKAVLESMVDVMDADDWAALNEIARKLAEKHQQQP